MEPTKLNFFQQIYYAVTKPKQYFKLSKLSGGRTTSFVFLFVLILMIFSTVLPVVDVFTGSDGIFRIFEEELPYFEMSDGELYVEERYEFKDSQSYLLIDTNIERFDLGDLDYINGNYVDIILISKTNFIQHQSLGRTQEWNFSNLNGFNFNNSIIQVFKPYIYLILVLGMMIAYVFLVGFYYLTALLYSLVGLLVSSVSNANLPFGRIFKVAIYSKVTIQLLYTVIGLFNFTAPTYLKNIISISVTCIYVVFGILSHNSEEAKYDHNPDITQNNLYHNNYYDNNNTPM